MEELDSYMYQTVGHGLIEAYAACTGLPLLRKRIVGTSVEQGLIYTGEGAAAGDAIASVTSRDRRDEVEDLEVLLRYAKDVYKISAVSSGAIASDYQRSRVERVCSKLGLVSLAYMWHQPQSRLLREMIVRGVDARLVKVAAAGLDPERHLGKSLGEMEGTLHRLRELYGSNVCGEGGEYETLTLDCPLFRRGRIVVDAWEVVVAGADALAPVAWMRVGAFHVEAKGAGNEGGGCEGIGEVIQVPDAYGGGEEGGGGGEEDEEEEEEEEGGEVGRYQVSCSQSQSRGAATFHGHCGKASEFDALLRSLKGHMAARYVLVARAAARRRPFDAASLLTRRGASQGDLHGHRLRLRDAVRGRHGPVWGGQRGLREALSAGQPAVAGHAAEGRRRRFDPSPVLRIEASQRAARAELEPVGAELHRTVQPGGFLWWARAVQRSDRAPARDVHGCLRGRWPGGGGGACQADVRPAGGGNEDRLGVHGALVGAVRVRAVSRRRVAALAAAGRQW